MRPTVTTLGSRGERFRERMVWSAITVCDAITTGSMLKCGDAPCDWRPLIVIQN